MDNMLLRVVDVQHVADSCCSTCLLCLFYAQHVFDCCLCATCCRRRKDKNDDNKPVDGMFWPFVVFADTCFRGAAGGAAPQRTGHAFPEHSPCVSAARQTGLSFWRHADVHETVLEAEAVWAYWQNVISVRRLFDHVPVVSIKGMLPRVISQQENLPAAICLFDPKSHEWFAASHGQE